MLLLKSHTSGSDLLLTDTCCTHLCSHTHSLSDPTNTCDFSWLMGGAESAEDQQQQKQQQDDFVQQLLQQHEVTPIQDEQGLPFPAADAGAFMIL